MRSIYLNLGSNRGERVANIEKAVSMLMECPLFAEGRFRRSPFYYSEPVGYTSDAEFVNLGVAIDFYADTLPCAPEEILDATQAIEHAIAPDSPHRNADGTYRDRIIDIDIIAIDGVTMQSERLTVPHPRAEARAFVMKPMAFLAPEWHPRASLSPSSPHNKKSIAEMGRDSVEAFKTKKKLPIAIILDNIRSQNNVGSIFRTADGFCAEHIALCGITGTPPSSEIHKTALGAEDSVDWAYYPDTLGAIIELKSKGFTILCLEQVHNSVSLERFEAKKDAKYAIVVGNEISGVDQAVVNAADICIEIPQAGTKHSLNVAVSAAIAMWHIFAQVK